MSAIRLARTVNAEAMIREGLPLVIVLPGAVYGPGDTSLVAETLKTYLKGSLQFEGVPAGSDGYSSGFGVTAEPDQQIVTLQDEDTWVRFSRSL